VVIKDRGPEPEARNPKPDDAYYMRKALALAERGRGRTSPNPVVGAVVVDDRGVIVGRGAHEQAGGPHAEVIALRDAGERARGATLYCTLEPCSHTGRTGPCAPIVAGAGVTRAVIALEDPNPLVNGCGLSYLRSHGLEVHVGTMRERAERQNLPFLTAIRRARPFVILKVAISLDGKIASVPGARTPLTGPAANRFIHRQRAEVDAIGIGSGTVLADDPLLTARGAYRFRTLTRVVFDRRLRTPPSCRLLSTLSSGPVIIVSTASACSRNPQKVSALIAAGATVKGLPSGELPEALRWLQGEGVSSLLLEGGAALHRAALDAGVVDVVQVYITPRTLGPDGVGWLEEGRLSLGMLRERSASWLGDDMLVEGYVYGTH
jgi:diaminohydroxyphosphoribosylaminopyrimidine deaminase/5-amino-6-(5-phosphoribosylamino)uracil reductase